MLRTEKTVREDTRTYKQFNCSTLVRLLEMFKKILVSMINKTQIFTARLMVTVTIG